MSKNSLKTLSEALPEATVPPMVGIGAIALQMAMSYHDTTVIKDGVMYQQMKMEGKNIGVLGLEYVFETAKRIEEHLMGTSDRIAGMVVETLQISMDSEADIHKMISDFLNQPIPEHPEPAALGERYHELDGILDNPEKCVMALKRSLGLEEHEINIYDTIIDRMNAEDKIKLIDKVRICLRFDELQNLIDDVFNKVIGDLPNAEKVFSGFIHSVMSVNGVASETQVREALLNCFLSEAGVGTSEKELFTTALSYYEEDRFYTNLKEIYIK